MNFCVGDLRFRSSANIGPGILELRMRNSKCTYDHFFYKWWIFCYCGPRVFSDFMSVYEPINVASGEIYGCGITHHSYCTTYFNKVGAGRNVYVCKKWKQRKKWQHQRHSVVSKHQKLINKRKLQPHNSIKALKGSIFNANIWKNHQ